MIWNRLPTALMIAASLFVAAELAGAQAIITTLAGNTGVFRGNGGPARNATLGSITAVATDASGNLFATEVVYYAGYNRGVEGHNLALKISPAGVLSVVAGNGLAGFSGDGGPAVRASLAFPGGVAADGQGNIYVADSGNHRIRKISASGTITTLVGNGTPGFSGDGGPATSASLNNPRGLAVDAAGNIYVADTGNNRLRKISATGVITTFASLGGPKAVALDASGNAYAVGGHLVRKVSLDGTITTVAGDGYTDRSCDGGCGRFFGDGGPATQASLYSPSGVAVDRVGNLYIADTGNNRIRKVTPDGTITTVAGGGTDTPEDGLAGTQANLGFPWAVSADSAGNVYMGTYASRLLKLNSDGTLARVAGTGLSQVSGFNGDGGPATSAWLGVVAWVAVDAAGNVYFTDLTKDRVHKVSRSGTISLLAGNGAFGSSGDGGPAVGASLRYPAGLAADAAGNVYIADLESHRVRKVDANGIISTVAGNGVRGFSGDNGPAISASLNGPIGLAVDARGSLYIADTQNQRVRRVSAGGVITTVAGNGVEDSAGDGGAATSASLYRPYALAFDSAGNLYIATNRIRIVSPQGIISTLDTLAGSSSVAVDSTNNIYAVGCSNSCIVRGGPGRPPSVVAGEYGTDLLGDGGPAANAYLESGALALDKADNLYIVSRGLIRKVVFKGPVLSPRGVVSAAGFAEGPAAPGSIVSLFGQNLAAAEVLSPGLPLPRFLGGVRVLIGGREAPLFYVGPNQINFQAPLDIETDREAPVVVESAGIVSAPEPLWVAGSRVSIFTMGGSLGNQGAVLIAGTNLLALPENASLLGRPARRGEAISIFCTGLGITDPPVAAGEPAPSNPMARVKNPVLVKIDDQPAAVTFAALAPGLVGVYRIDAVVPANVTVGNAVRLTVQHGIFESNTVTFAVQ